MIITKLIASAHPNRPYDIPRAADIRCTVLANADENRWLQSFNASERELLSFTGVYDGKYWILEGVLVRDQKSSAWPELLEVELSADRISPIPNAPVKADNIPPRVSPVSERVRADVMYDGGPPLWMRLGRFCQRRGWHNWAKRLMGLWTWNQDKGLWQHPRQDFDIVDAELQYRRMRKEMDL